MEGAEKKGLTRVNRDAHSGRRRRMAMKMPGFSLLSLQKELLSGTG